MTKTRSPTTIGPHTPRPGSGDFQATFSVALNVTGSLASARDARAVGAAELQPVGGGEAGGSETQKYEQQELKRRRVHRSQGVRI